MSTFEFRAWDEIGKVMVYFDFQHLVRAGINGQMDDGSRPQDLLDPSVPKMQYIRITDRNGKKVFDGDIVRVYDINRCCECGDWQECEDKTAACEDHPGHSHKHEEVTDCENFLCTQIVAPHSGLGYFSEEDTGDYCPSLGADEIEVEVIGNKYENPDWNKKTV